MYLSNTENRSIYVAVVILLCLGRISPVGQIVQIIPVWGGWTVHVVVPVTNSELLVEAGLICTHVGNSSAILIAHVENHAVEFQISIESNSSVSAVKIECDIRELSPPLFNVVAGFFHLNKSKESEGYEADDENTVLLHFKAKM